MNDLLKISEVARFLRVDGSTVRRWIINGALDVVRLPRIGPRQGYRIKRATLNKVLGGRLAKGEIQSHETLELSEYDVYIDGFGMENVPPSCHSTGWRIGN